MAGNDAVSSSQPSGDQMEFWDPQELPTTNNPPRHKSVPKGKSSASEIFSKPTENKQENSARDDADPTRFGDWEKNGRCVDF